jgi:hydrogenase expression/formation protein HypE
MEIGKVPNNVLKEIILNKIKHNRKEVILRPQIGEDCSAVDFGDNVCVLSSDPVTGSVNEVGKIAVHVSCNDIASCGVEPIGLLITILAPPQSAERDLDLVMSQICTTADSLNVDIIGGHTEVTNAVNRFVIITTAIGKAPKDKLVTTSGAKIGDDIIMTKSVGLEGTSIIAHDKEKEIIAVLGKESVDRAKSFTDKISVIDEGIIAGVFGVSAMHDVTEGGILGAVWEVAEASKVGVEIYKESIPIEAETRQIAGLYSIDPLKLISSGCMLITCPKGIGLVKRLNDSKIKAAIIGKVVAGNNKTLIGEGLREEIEQPKADELYKVI